MWKEAFDPDDKDLSHYIGVSGDEKRSASCYDRSDLTYDEHCLRRVGTQFHGFMCLPREIRDNVYRFLLVRGKIFIRNELQLRELPTGFCPSRSLIRENYIDYSGKTYPRYHDLHSWEPTDTDRAPRMSLIRGVSKMVQEEAERIFWGSGNQFVFPAGYWTYPSAFCTEPYRWHDEEYQRHLPPAKDLSYAFDMRDVLTYGDYNDREDVLEGLEEDEDEISPLEFREEIHRMRVAQQTDLWESRCMQLTRILALHRLELDFHQFCCPVGCCRRAKDVCELLARDNWRVAFPLRIDIIGHRAAERQKLTDIIAGSDEEARSRIHFSHHKLW